MDWRPTETAPEKVAVLGKYPIEQSAPFQSFGIWVVWMENGLWYGDHHSSWRGTEKEEPLAWKPIEPDSEEKI